MSRKLYYEGLLGRFREAAVVADEGRLRVRFPSPIRGFCIFEGTFFEIS
jgi:hypothetical protein